ncbi:MAG: hypothetical protein ACRD2Z_07370 [Thermoanaerobaculia bacterium]
MIRTPLVLLTLGAAIAVASAQPPTLPRTTPPNRVTDVTVHNIALPLDPGEAERLRRRLRSSLEQQAAAAPHSSALLSAGLHPESDVVEQADAAERAGTIGPVGVGLALPPPPGPKMAVDPALAEVTRLQLRARLDRDPTAAELTAELQAFDARVARANQWLVANRTRLAKVYASAGTLPPAFDDAALDPAPPDRRSDTPAVRDAFRELFRALLAQPDPTGTTPTTTTPATPPITRDPIPTPQPDAVPRRPTRP